MPRRILILQSDRQLAKSLQSFLMLQGYDAEVHVSPQDAILAIDAHQPDLVIADLILAGRSGAEFLYELRSYPEWHPIKVIVLTHQPPQELEHYYTGFGQLNVSAYWQPMAGSFKGLAIQIGQLLQPAAA